MHDLLFLPEAAKELDRLDKAVRTKLLLKLEERLENPEVESARLSGELSSCFKIKLKREGVRLVYQVDNFKVIVTVISIGKREESAVYRDATKRLGRQA
jgi:mRNA interferase RelE/StbE